MSSDVIVAVLGTLGVGSVAAAVVAGLFSRKKLGADATKIIQEAASGVVSDLREELGRADAKVDRAEAKMDAMRVAFAEERESWRRVLQLHVAWDSIAIAKVNSLLPPGSEPLPPAPPLLPPTQLDLSE